MTQLVLFIINIRGLEAFRVLHSGNELLDFFVIMLLAVFSYFMLPVVTFFLLSKLIVGLLTNSPISKKLTGWYPWLK
jgi:hypothetical protein